MFVVLVTMTSGRVGKPCRCTIQEKTGNVLTHLLSYLLHLMFMALWRKPVICRCPYGSLPALTWATCVRAGLPPVWACEASLVDITCSGASLYCLGDEYMTQGKQTLTVGPSLINLDGEYRGGGVVEEIEENEGGDASL